MRKVKHLLQGCQAKANVPKQVSILPKDDTGHTKGIDEVKMMKLLRQTAVTGFNHRKPFGNPFRVYNSTILDLVWSRSITSVKSHLLSQRDYSLKSIESIDPKKSCQTSIRVLSSFSTIKLLSSTSPESSDFQQRNQQIQVRSVRRRKARSARVHEPTRGEQRRLTGYLSFCEKRWNENFLKLRAYVEQIKREDSTAIPFPDDVQLRKWLLRQRHEYQRRCNAKSSFLTDHRLQKLQSLGFTMQSKRERSWEKVYQQLCEYVARNDGLFPYDANSFDSLDDQGKHLYLWCERQRVQYNRYKLKDKSELKAYISEEQIAKLDKIDFTWSLREGVWDHMYEQLKEYYSHHGDCLVPAKFVANPKLAKWVETQRRQYALSKESKQNNMTNRRVTLLNRLDFAWDPHEARWQLKYKELEVTYCQLVKGGKSFFAVISHCIFLKSQEYVTLNGTGMLPRYNDPQVASLYRWLRYQQKAYQNWVNEGSSSMTPARKKLLDQLGVVWTDEK